MGYRVFRFNIKDALECRTGSDGFQPKFISEDHKYFVKVQCLLGGYLLNDWKVEVIATKLCEHLGIPCLHQEPCHVIVNGKEYMGVYSDNLCYYGIKTKSFRSFLNDAGYNPNDSWYVKLNTVSKMKALADVQSKITGVKYETILKYIVQCAFIDTLVYNGDRHFGNYHYAMSNSGITLAPLHDFGMGLFEDNTSIREYTSVKECYRHAYVSPYGEDAFDMLGILESAFECISAVRQTSEKPLLRKEMFPNKFAYEYWQEISSAAWGK